MDPVFLLNLDPIKLDLTISTDNFRHYLLCRDTEEIRVRHFI